jgi:DNA polymerase
MVLKLAEFPTAEPYLPERITLPALTKAVQGCRGCPLYKNATQAVFGEGPTHAKIFFIGEQPGDQEDLAGKPFVGPAGKLLDGVLEEVGIERSDVYVTNAVNHFKWEPRGTRRIHSKPNSREMAACKPWLAAELQVIKPQMVICLGATAAQDLFGAKFRITKERGKIMEDTGIAPMVMATVHPSSILRAPDHDAREKARKEFTEDLAKAAKHLG